MKRHLSMFIALSLVTVGAFASPTKITITPPTVETWSQDVTLSNGTTVTYNATASELSGLNTALADNFQTIEDTLNNDFFSNLSGFELLPKGFANATTATFDTASLAGFQTYDLFAISAGFNLGASLPTFDPAEAQTLLEDMINTGDVYAGLATGGFAAQAGLNLGFLVPHLYGSVKMGFTPDFAFQGYSFQQGMFGVGVNYTLLPQVDILFGFIKWRGVSLGSGFTINGSSINAEIPVPDQSQKFTAKISGQDVDLTGTASNIKAKLSLENSSFVIPIEAMTSIQALWFLNFGVGAGVDLAFSSSKIDLGASSDVNMSGATNATFKAGKVALDAATSSAGGDFLVPRLAASIGLNLAVLKLDIPVSYYPTTQSFAFGVTGGVVW